MGVAPAPFFFDFFFGGPLAGVRGWPGWLGCVAGGAWRFIFNNFVEYNNALEIAIIDGNIERANGFENFPCLFNRPAARLVIV